MTTVLRINDFSDYSSAKNSFDRFGDDLSEVLLGYLYIDDKFRFECVSKQFQRVIFNKIYSINVNHQRLSCLLGPFHYKKRVEIESFEAVLKKCPNIRRILSAEDAINEEEVFSTIIENCNQLHEIESDFENLKTETIQRFCTKFGPKLKKINFIPNNRVVQMLLKGCPNLEMMGYDWISLEDFFDGQKLLINKLKSFSFYYFPEDIQRITSFVKSNRTSLRCLEMIVYDKSLTTFHTKTLFKELSDLGQLKSLGIFYYVSTDVSFVDFIVNLDKKYPKLLKIDFDLRINNSSDILKVYKSLNCMKNLKQINLKNHNEDNNRIPITSETLKDNKSLQHLRITGNTFEFRDQFFASIDKHFPKLLSLHLTNAHISGQSLSDLSRISSLRSLSLISLSMNSLITESDVFDLIGKSQKIGSIYLINTGFTCDFNEGDIQQLKAYPHTTPDMIAANHFNDSNSGTEDSLQYLDEENLKPILI